MKKIFLFLLLLAPLFATAQNYKPTTPTGSTSFTPTFRYKDSLSVDSLRRIWLSSSGKWYQISTVGLSGGGGGTVSHANQGLHLSGDTVQMGDLALSNDIEIADPAFNVDFFMSPSTHQAYLAATSSKGAKIHIFSINTPGDRYSDLTMISDTMHSSVTLYETHKVLGIQHDRGLSIDDIDGIKIENEIDSTAVFYDDDIVAKYSTDTLLDNQIPYWGYVKSHISGGGSGTVTSITPGVGFLSHTPITTSGTMDVDTASTIVSKTFAGRYITAASTNTLTNKSGNISQWTNDSGYITSAPTAANPTASIGFTAVNGAASTYTRSDGAPKADSAVIRSAANSYTLAAMQTKLNNYALTSSLPVAANPSGLLTFTAANGSNTTYLRNDGLHAIDSTVVRSAANSRTLAQTQTALNLKLNVSDTAAMAYVHLAKNETITGQKTFNKAIIEQQNGIATTPTDGFYLQNGIASTSGATRQISPNQHFGARVWNTTATAADNWIDFINYADVTSAATPTGTLTWRASRSTTSTPSYATIMTIDNNGSMALPMGGLNSAGTINGNTYTTNAGGRYQGEGLAAFYSHGTAAGTGFWMNTTGTGWLTITPSGANTGSLGHTASSLGATPTIDLSWSTSGLINIPGLTASKVVFTDASKNLTSTGIGTSSQYIAGDGSLGTIGSKPHTIFTPTTGGTVTLTNNQYNIINPAGALLALTVTLPSSPANNDCVFIKFTQNVTTVTYAGGTVVDGIVGPVAGSLVVLTYDLSSNSWY